MPPKQTPYQFSQGLQYVHKDPPFLAKLKQSTEPSPEQQKFQLDNRNDDDDDNYDELDGAQVVVLKEGRHLTEEQARMFLKKGGEGVKVDDADVIQGTEEEPSDFDAEASRQSPTDDTGRILFRKPKISKKTKQDGIDELKEAISVAKKRKGFSEDKQENEEDDKDRNTEHKEKVRKIKKTKKTAVGGLSFDQVD